MKIIFCSDPLQKKQVDALYAEEKLAAEKCGFDVGLINLEALTEDKDVSKAVDQIDKAFPNQKAVYRGWMMRPAQYSSLYHALKEKGILLINTPTEYQHCHYLPDSFDVIKSLSPQTLWMEAVQPLDFTKIMKALGYFGRIPIIVKDYVKSRKHEWQDAFYIPSAADPVAVRRVVSNFVTRQGHELNEGLVFRRFVEFQIVGRHPQSEMPLFQEYRLFFFKGELIDYCEYWDTGEYPTERPPLDKFSAIARNIRSNFFTMDIAKTATDEWIIVELGDGQVAGLPEKIKIDSFYQKLLKVLSAINFL